MLSGLSLAARQTPTAVDNGLFIADLVATSNLVHGRQMFGCGIGVNGAGMTVYASSPPVVADLLPPAPGDVHDGPHAGVDLDCTVWCCDDDVDGAVDGTSNLAVTWERFHDSTSGVVDVKVALGTSPLSDDLMAWQVVPLQSTTFLHPNASAVADAITDTLGASSAHVTLFWSVRATDGVGRSTTVSSDGVRVACVGLVGSAREACLESREEAIASGVGAAACVALTKPMVAYSGPTGVPGVEADEVVVPHGTSPSGIFDTHTVGEP